jgi:hypothetical protein
VELPVRLRGMDFNYIHGHRYLYLFAECPRRKGQYSESKKVYMYPIPDGLRDGAVSLYSSKIVDKEIILFLMPVFIVQVTKLV